MKKVIILLFSIAALFLLGGIAHEYGRFELSEFIFFLAGIGIGACVARTVNPDLPPPPPPPNPKDPKDR